MAAVSRIPREGQGVIRQSAGSADETVTEVLGFWASREGAVRDSLITTSTWSVPDGLVNEGNDHDDTKTWITLSGGTLGAEYTLVNTVTLASGMIDTRSFLMVIQAG